MLEKCRMLLITALLLSNAVRAEAPLEISYAHNAVNELRAGEQLNRLVQTYDLSKWLVTKKVVIDNEAIPHSHPVLTLHARHLRDDELLLSTLVHEQMHWYIAAHRHDAEGAIAELRTLYPDIPVGFPQGSNDAEGNYEHLLVVSLEWRANRELLGELRARQVMEFWATDHYTWIYRTILDHRRQLDDILRAHHLIPGA
ncbi:MAG TPA: hypothetical protein VIF60_02775 [Burkholderiaceae bacterium]|jgi:hypothetical protein